MSKLAIVFWSGTGNTQAMAEYVADGAKAAGAEITMIDEVETFTASDVANYDAIAFGCPSMGAEVLEETFVQPMWDSVKGSLFGKTVSLFGSYGWGDGEWMRDWEEDAKSTGCNFVESYICCETPDEEAAIACKALGEKLASA